MTITYIEHSGFTVELSTCVLVFDYFQGELPKWDKDKPVYVFVSHKHQDHFGFVIFDLVRTYEKVHYFLSSDIKLSEKYLARKGVPPLVKKQITAVAKNSTLTYENLDIRTLLSTDAGVAFVVEVEGKRIYHAGDLNWWHWEGEPESWNRDMEQRYRREIDRIAAQHFDVAFVPLDPRLGEAYDYGINYFMEKTITDHVYPMHMWREYDWIDQYKKSQNASAWADKIEVITAPGQSFTFSSSQ